MTRTEAVEAVVSLCGGSEVHKGPFTSLSIYAFPSLATADRAKGILDALLPGCTGAVFGSGRLLVDHRPLEAA